jgi:hypothetical protein
VVAIDPTDIVKSARDVVSSDAISGSLSDAWQAILGDRIAAWRLTNAAKTQIKVKKEFDRLGLRPNNNRIPERYAITWFEEASKQDEEEIQDLFARLLAQAAAGNEAALDRRNLEIVSRLTPDDAALFQELADGGWGARRFKNTYCWDEGRHFFTDKSTKVKVERFNRSFEHLITVGILSRLTQSEEKLNDRSLTMGPRIQTIVNNIVIMTEAGRSLYEAVKYSGSV